MAGEVKMCHRKWLNFLVTVQFSIVFWLTNCTHFNPSLKCCSWSWSPDEFDLEKTIVRGKSSKPRTRSVLAHSVDLLTHSQFSSDAKELDPYAILFTLVTFWHTRYSLICMTQDPYILFSTIVNLNWHYLTIDDREKSEKSTAILKIQLRANVKIRMKRRWPEIDRFPSSGCSKIRRKFPSSFARNWLQSRINPNRL